MAKVVCACGEADSREEKMFTTFRGRQEGRMDKVGKGEARMRSEKKTKQNDKIVYVQRSTQD